MTLPPVPLRGVLGDDRAARRRHRRKRTGIACHRLWHSHQQLQFGNALLIAGVVISCTGVILIGMWLAARELMNVVRLGAGQTARRQRRGAASRCFRRPFAAAVGSPCR